MTLSANTNWLKQTAEDKLFPELIWSRPQNRRQAGKLLIVGGSLQNFSQPAEAYNHALKAGIGTTRVVLPDSLKRVVSNYFSEAIFVPSTPSGSFGVASVGELLNESSWADAVLISGGIGSNSETAVMIETFINKYTGSLTLSGDSIELLKATIKGVLLRPDTTLVLDFTQLQRLVRAVAPSTLIPSTINMYQLVSILEDFTEEYKINLSIIYKKNVIVAVNSMVSTTEISTLLDIAKLAAYSTVLLLQNPKASFEALSTAAVEI